MGGRQNETPECGNPATPWHPKNTAYCCSLPGLTGFTGLRRTGLSPRIGGLDFIILHMWASVFGFHVPYGGKDIDVFKERWIYIAIVQRLLRV